MTADMCVSGATISDSHDWTEKEVRVRLDSLTYQPKLVRFTWECFDCGARKTDEVPYADYVSPLKLTRGTA